MKKLLCGLIAIIMSGMMACAPVMATCNEDQLKNGCVSTSILSGGCSCDNGQGSEVTRILTTVVNVMTIGVGILGVIGIMVVGIQYLTAGGDEGKMRKAKQRLSEIVIGIVVYVLIYALLYFLIPDFKPF